MSAASRLQASWLRRGLLARALLPLSWLYRLAVEVGTGCYRLGLKRPVNLPVPVIVVGNLVAGGAGKTPTVIALVRLLRERGFTPGVVSRGYGRASSEITLVDRHTPVAQAGDEPLLIHLRTGAPVAVGADRVAAGLALLRAQGSVNVVVSDDGLQHRRLARDAQVIVFDERGAGNGWLLPAGPLREPMPVELPLHSLVLYNAAVRSTALQGEVVSRRLGGFASLADWSAGRPATLEPLAGLRGRPLLAAAGLARPQRFFGMLRALGLSFSELPLPDHWDFAVMPWPADTPDVVVTEKDAVKLRPGAMGSVRVWVATLDFELPPESVSTLMAWLPTPTPTPRPTPTTTP